MDINIAVVVLGGLVIAFALILTGIRCLLED